MDPLDLVVADQVKKEIPDFNAGDDVAVHLKVIEGDKERIQIFRGLVIQKRGNGINKTFTVRKVSGGVGVERVFPLYSPRISKIERTRKGKVRQGKIFYIRKLKGKAARIEEAR